MTMMYWIEKFSQYSGNDYLMNVDQFTTILNDRTFNWKLRSTIDYSPADIDEKYYEKMNSESMPKGAQRKLGLDKSATEGPLSEGDFFHNSAMFLQKRDEGDEIVQERTEKLSKTKFAEAEESPYEGVTAPKANPDKQKARKIIFNVLDVNMDGHLSLKEFFEMIKF